MKVFSLLVALALVVTVGGVYATWVYSSSTDVKDVTSAKAMTMTDATFTGTDGTYTVDASGLQIKIDPKEGTTHDTALVMTGSIVITFTPNTYAPPAVKQNGVVSTYEFGLSNQNWKYKGQDVITLTHPGEKHTIEWVKNEETGVFTCTLTADQVAGHFQLTQITLGTSAEYDAYDAILTQGQLTIHVSDGQYNAPTDPSQGT